ncbi:hypothetical protein E3N88_09998 [Mikania micrantha]|uniref:CCHC-type domain-containing protein n=1 Tax=Mikania micrantha TaxID=192012 RepID=A0A5N6PBQ6_9ASTR|nr:hypothetical protein E3N88_09998 [Mikania micrantha]
MEETKRKRGKCEALQKRGKGEAVMICVRVLYGQDEDEITLSIFRDTLKNLMEQTDVDTRDRPSVKQKDIVSSFVPNNEELTSDVRVPSGIRNKGSGSHKRFKSKREQAISRMGKRSRGCHACGQAGHDRRTCPALRGPQKT